MVHHELSAILVKALRVAVQCLFHHDFQLKWYKNPARLGEAQGVYVPDGEMSEDLDIVDDGVADLEFPRRLLRLGSVETKFGVFRLQENEAQALDAEEVSLD